MGNRKPRDVKNLKISSVFYNKIVVCFIIKAIEKLESGANYKREVSKKVWNKKQFNLPTTVCHYTNSSELYMQEIQSGCRFKSRKITLAT